MSALARAGSKDRGIPEGLRGAAGGRRARSRTALDGLPLRALRNHGREPAVMIAFTRLR
jgi:hypothetical protein